MKSDFLIIGGGIAGISAAARLSALGSVILLEQEASLAHHASARSAALYEPHYGNPVVVELSLASGDFYRAGQGLLSPRGLLLVSNAQDAPLARDEAAELRLEPIPPDEARAMVPVLNRAVAFAAHGAHAWDIDTDLLIQGFLRQARANGARIETAAAVTALSRQGGQWHAVTSKGEFCANVVINAAGPWADLVAGMAGLPPIGLTPLRRSMARIPAPGGHDVSAWPMIFGAGEGWYAKPDAGALIVSPAEEDPMPPHDAWPDDMVLAEGLARYEEMVTEPVTRLLASWAGLRTFAPDRIPVIGFDPRAEGFFWLAGQGGYGFQTAPTASLLAAELIGGTARSFSPDLFASLSPARFA